MSTMPQFIIDVGYCAKSAGVQGAGEQGGYTPLFAVKEDPQKCAGSPAPLHPRSPAFFAAA